MIELKQIVSNLKKRITTNMLILFTFAIILLGILIWRAFYLHNYISVGDTKNGHIFDYWNMFWTCVGTMVIPLTVIFFLIDKNNETKELTKKEEKELKSKKRALIEDEIPNFWSTYNTHYQLRNPDEKDTPRENLLPETNDMITSGIRILLKINAIEADFNRSSNVPDDSTNDVADMKDYAELVVRFLSAYQQLIKDDFPILNSLFERFGNQSDPDSAVKLPITSINKTKTKLNLPEKIIKLIPDSNNINPTNILIIRTLDSSGAIDNIKGDWKMSAEKAKNIKYIIGVTGNAYSTKIYLKTLKVSNFRPVGDRIRFEYENTILDNTTGTIDTDTENMSQYVSELVSNWNAINPIVYLPHLAELFSQRNMYQTFEDEFSQKIAEYNARNNNKSSDNLQVVKELTKKNTNSQFRIRFRSKKIDNFLSERFNKDERDISNEYNLRMAYESSSYWYEIISDNQHNTINFASVFFLNKASNDTDVIKNFYNYKTAKTPEEMVTPFVADDKKKNGYIITIDELSKNDIKDQESLTHFFTNIFNEIDKDIEFVEKITK